MWVWFWWDCYIITNWFGPFFNLLQQVQDLSLISAKVLLIIIVNYCGRPKLLSRNCKKANVAAVIKVTSKKSLIGHRCRHPGDGGTKIGHPSPVPQCPTHPKWWYKIMRCLSRSDKINACQYSPPCVRALTKLCNALNICGQFLWEVSCAPGHI